MNVNLFSKLILVCTNLVLRIQVLEQQIEKQSLEIADLKAKQKQQLSKIQQIVKPRDQEIAQANNNFMSLVSHELRTPITTILLNVQSLLTFSEQWSEQKRFLKLEQIENAAQRIKQILQNLLTINRIDINQINLTKSDLDLVQFCANLVREFSLNNPRNYQINFVNQAQVSSVYLDPQILTTILTNLLINACQYSDFGGIIILKLTSKKRTVNFVIEDQGRGIKSSDLPHLFEAFYRGENVTGVSGSGLGLTVVKKLIDLSKGKIMIKSKIGVGTIVTVSLPLS